MSFLFLVLFKPTCSNFLLKLPFMKWVKKFYSKHYTHASQLHCKFSKHFSEYNLFYSESKFILQSILETQDKNSRQMVLTNEGLTSLCHTEWMLLCTTVDLSHNSLTSIKTMSNLQCLKCLCLDNNHLKDLDGLQYCLQLCQLSVKINGKTFYHVSGYLYSTFRN